MKIKIALLGLSALLAASSAASATTYYVDPATGSMSNPGTSALPWSTLAAVFTAGKVFAAGDVINCRTGYHGAPTITKANTGNVTIQPDTGASPTMSNILFNTAASHWVLNGFDICPENAGAGTYLPGTNLVYIVGPSNYITIENCHIRAVNDITGYAITDWYNNVGTGCAIFVRGPNCTITNNQIENVAFGIVVDKPATFTYVGHNTTINFYEDGSRGLGDDCVWEYNTIMNSYVSDSNHDDFFQSWSIGTDGVVGDGTVYRNTLRGNYFISQTDPNQPLFAPPMGIGCYDGMYNGWLIENNVISSHTWHGISLYGAINCTIVNNTVVQDPFEVPVSNDPTPWIHVFEHKPVNSTTPWPVTSSGNLLRNNVAANGVGMDNSYDGIADHNISSQAYTTLYTSYTNYNFLPIAGSPLIGAGSTYYAPTYDILQIPRSVPYDIGAYASNVTPVTYSSWCTMNKLTGTNALQSTVIAHDGLNNLYKYALGLNPTTNYNPGSTPLPAGSAPLPLVFMESVSGVNYLALTFTGVATDVTYKVQASSDLTGPWTTIQAFPSGSFAPGTETVQDTQSIISSKNRFFRLQTTNP